MSTALIKFSQGGNVGQSGHAFIGGIPNSIAFSQINGTASMVLRPPLYKFLSQTA